MGTKRELISGVLYTAFGKYSGIIISTIISSFLSRLITPREFGLLAMVTVFTALFQIIGDVGIGAAVIQKKEFGQKEFNNIFTFTIFLGLIMAGAFFLCAKPIAIFYHEPRLVEICRWLSLPFLIGSIGSIPGALLSRNKEFRFIAIRGVSIQIFVGVISITAAFLGFGIYALIIQSILSTFLATIINYIHHPLYIRFKGLWVTMSSIASFSIYVFLFNIINYFSRNLDNILIGRYINAMQLGYYNKAYSLMMMPLSNITFIITPVMQPIFSDFQNNLRVLADNYIKLLSMLAYVSFPVAVIAFFVSEETILILFGNQWIPAIYPFKVISLTIATQILISTTGSIYMSSNNTKAYFIGGLCCTTCVVTCFIIAIVFWGTINAVAWGFFIGQIANTIISFYILFRKLRYPIINFMKKLIRPILIAVCLALVLFAIDKITTNWNIVVTFTIKILVSIVLTLVLVQRYSEYDAVGYLKLKWKGFKEKHKI